FAPRRFDQLPHAHPLQLGNVHFRLLELLDVLVADRAATLQVVGNFLGQRQRLTLAVIGAHQVLQLLIARLAVASRASVGRRLVARRLGARRFVARRFVARRSLAGWLAVGRTRPGGVSVAFQAFRTSPLGART